MAPGRGAWPGLHFQKNIKTFAKKTVFSPSWQNLYLSNTGAKTTALSATYKLSNCSSHIMCLKVRSEHLTDFNTDTSILQTLETKANLTYFCRETEGATQKEDFGVISALGSIIVIDYCTQSSEDATKTELNYWITKMPVSSSTLPLGGDTQLRWNHTHLP